MNKALLDTDTLSEIGKGIYPGEEFTITKHGKPVARLIPTLTAKPKSDVRAAVEAMKRFRKGKTLVGLSIREMIENGRRL